MINPGFYKDPAGTLTMGFVALVWGMVVLLFHERLFFPKKSKSEHMRKWEKLFFQASAVTFIFAGVYLACVGACALLTHTGLHR